MYYQDVYIEKSVRRVVPPFTKVLNIILYLLTIWGAFLFIAVDYRIYGIPLMITIVATYFVSQSAKLDFDYTYTNGCLDITRIVRKRRRKEIVSCEMKDVMVVAVSKSEPVQQYIGRSMKTFDCTSHDKDTPYYTMIVKGEQANSDLKILFEPGEEMLEAMKRIAPDKVFI